MLLSEDGQVTLHMVPVTLSLLNCKIFTLKVNLEKGYTQSIACCSMLKGWVTIEGTLAELYPLQEGNTYYYDTKTGLMAKGALTIDGEDHYFDVITGVMIY